MPRTAELVAPSRAAGVRGSVVTFWLLPLLVLLAAACQRADEGGASRSPSGAPPAPPAFAGAQACDACHPREAEAYRGSHHALAMQTASPGTVLGDFKDARFTQRGATTSFHRRDDRFVVTTDGSDGRPADFDVAYTFGVMPLQQYLLPLAGGRFQALTVAWDARPRADGGQRWYSLYPGERIAPGDPLHWTGREQTWNYQCAECHSTDLHKGFDLARNRYETRWAELSVSCEACHGPGSAHVAWARARRPGAASVRGPATGLVVRLRRPPGAWEMKDPQRGIAQWTGSPRDGAELDACARCHARRRPIVDPYPYGRPFLDTHQPVLLTEALYYPDGQILGEVYEYGSFLQSRMQRAGVTCSDCHEPHALRLRAEGNALCGGCHLPARFDAPGHHRHRAGSPGARCVSCHMPARTYMGVDARRDHGFRVPRPELSVTLGTPNPCTQCHAGRGASWAADVVKGWRGADAHLHPSFAAALDAGRRGRLDAAAQLEQLARDLAQPGIARATALALLPPFLAPADPPAVIEASLGDADPLVRGAAFGSLEGLTPERRAALGAPGLRDPVRSVRLAAARVLAESRPALTAEARADFDSALAELIASELVSADRPEAHLNLASLYARLGRTADAESALRTALFLDPRFVPAMVNLADLFRAEGRDADGERFLDQALRIEPENAEVLHAVGLLRVRQGRRDEGVKLLRQAAARRPEAIRFGYVYAVALYSTGRPGAAISTLEDLHRQRPADREVLTALVTYLRDRGEVTRALAHAETLATLLPGDRSVLGLRDELRRRASRP